APWTRSRLRPRTPKPRIRRSAVAARRTNAKDARIAKERARTYRAHQELHQVRERRRKRDNVIAVAATVPIVAGVIVAQAAYLNSTGQVSKDEGPGLVIPTTTPVEVPPLFDDDSTTEGGPATDAPSEQQASTDAPQESEAPAATDKPAATEAP